MNIYQVFFESKLNSTRTNKGQRKLAEMWNSFLMPFPLGKVLITTLVQTEKAEHLEFSEKHHHYNF